MRKKLVIGIVSMFLAIIFAFCVVSTPIKMVMGNLTFGGYYFESTVFAVLLFLSSAVAFYCFFYKIGKRKLHSTGTAVAIVCVGVLFAGIADLVFGKYIVDSAPNRDGLKMLGNSIASVIATLIGGFLTGFGGIKFGVNEQNFDQSVLHSVKQVPEKSDENNESVSKTIGAILAFFLGGLGIHRYYLGYKKQGIIQTSGFVSLAIVYIYYAIKVNDGSTISIISTVFMLIFMIYGIVTSIWAFVDFIRILTGKLQPADGSTYSENQPRQVQVIQNKENASVTIDAIANLAKLREQGILTEEEFQKKKTELLKKI